MDCFPKVRANYTDNYDFKGSDEKCSYEIFLRQHQMLNLGTLFVTIASFGAIKGPHVMEKENPISCLDQWFSTDGLG